MAEENSFISSALPANIKNYISLYCATKEKDNAFKEEAQRVIDAFEGRIKSFAEKTKDRFFLEDYWAIATEGGRQKLERTDKYKEEKRQAEKDKETALSDLKSEERATWNVIKSGAARGIPLFASYQIFSSVFTSAAAVGGLSAIVLGVAEIVIRKVSKTEEEKIDSRYKKRLQEVEDWFSRDKKEIYGWAEKKAKLAYKAYYGDDPPFPDTETKQTEPPVKLYQKEGRTILEIIGWRK